MKRKLQLVLIIFLLNFLFIPGLKAQFSAGPTLSSQLPKEPVNIQSPNAAGLGLYGDFPVSYFTGIPQIEIPLYTLKEREIAVPISLSYHASGFRPDQHPGWVGQGWSLNAGGVISRTVNGLPDEENIQGDVSNPLTGFENSGYYYQDNRQLLSGSSWNTAANVKYIAENPPDPNNPTISHRDTEPDEFSFNFGNYSGKFYLDPNGNWKVKCDKPIKVIFDGTMLSVPFTPPLPSSSYQSGYPGFTYSKTFSGFTIITEDGTQYKFGGTTDAIEYGIELFEENHHQWIANSWYLTSITSKNGNETVNFIYQHDSMIDQIVESTYEDLGSGGNAPNLSCNSSSSLNVASFFSGQLIYPVYLTKISTPTFTASFFRCNTTELTYGGTGDPTDIYDGEEINFGSTPDPAHGYMLFPFLVNSYATSGSCIIDDDTNPKSLNSDSLQSDYYTTGGGGAEPTSYYTSNLQWKQLSTIYIQDNNGKIIKQYEFNYSNDPTKRLTLNSLIESGGSGTPSVNKPPYVFSYSPPPAGLTEPYYVAHQTDHWGFWNGITQLPPGIYPNTLSADLNSYYGKKTPDFNYTLTNTLTEIKYPTGGITDFTYEPNDYSKQLMTVRSSGYNTFTSNQAAGGIRVRSIISHDMSVANSNIEKDYIYVSNFSNSYNNSQLSSGVLGGQFQYYFNDYEIPLINSSGTYHKQIFSSQSQLPGCINGMGSHIGYSEVTERRSDGTYTKYFYTNFDNGHLDEPTTVLQPSRVAYEPFTSLEEERGKLKSEEWHNVSDALVKQIVYEYTALNKANEFVPSIKASAWNICMVGGQGNTIAAEDGAAFKYYTYSYLPTSKTTTDFDINGLNPVTTAETYAYDNPIHRQVTRTYLTNSKGETMVNVNLYPQDFASGSGFIDKMVAINNVGSPIENVTMKLNTAVTPPSFNVLSASITEYPLATGDYPLTNYVLDQIQPLPLNTTAGISNFVLTNGVSIPTSTASALTLPGGIYARDSHYRATASFDYDLDKIKDFNIYTGAPSGSTQATVLPTAFLWDVSRRYPIAETKYAGFQQVAFTGFEENETPGATRANNPDNWNIPAGVITTATARTGHNCGNIAGQTLSTVDQLPAGSYIISYWSKAGVGTLSGGVLQNTTTGQTTADGWTYYQQTIQLTGAANVSISGNTGTQYIDDLRLYPVGALMTTYTYDPLVGMTSSTDQKGEVTFYDYDNFQRLMNIRDKDGNVTKHYDYNYQGQ